MGPISCAAMRLSGTGSASIAVLGLALVAGFALLVADFALLAAPASATYLPQERIPTQSTVYRDLERLSARFAIAPRFLSMRPLRLIEAREFLRGLAGTHPGVESDPAWVRAMRFLDVESRGAARPFLSVTGDQGEALEASPYASFTYSDDPRNQPEIDRDYRAGIAVAAALDSTIFVINAYAGTASQGGRGTPDFGTSNAWVEGVSVNSWFEEAYVEFPVSRLRILAGHTWLRWGPGREGTLALSDAAPAQDMLKAEITMFRNWRFEWFVSVLDPGPQTYLAGHRLEASLSPRLTFGITEMARFDGTSQAPLYWMPFVPYPLWEKRPKTSPDGAVPGDTANVALTKNNVLMSFDASWLPVAGTRVWGEFLLDDISFSTDYKPNMIGYQAGLETRRALGGATSGAGRAISGSIEYTRVHNYTYSAWHGHHFGHQGFPVGFVLGPDVAALSAELAYEHGANWEFRLRGEWRKKGEGQVGDPWTEADGEVDASEFSGVVERETRVSGTIAYSPSRRLRVEATVGATGIENRDHLPADVINETPIRLTGKLEW